MPVHFEPDVEFVDLFLPINISSAARAKAFLWMIFHYHEGPNLANPFADDHARRNPGKVPWLHRLSREEQAQQNIDPPEELEWGRKMAQARSRFLQDLVAGGELDKAARTLSGSSSYGSSSAWFGTKTRDTRLMPLQMPSLPRRVVLALSRTLR